MDKKDGLAKTENTDLATQDDFEVSLERPDFTPLGGRSGTEHLTKDDVQMPRMGLAQQMSPELVDSDPKFIEGLRIGTLFNNLTGQIYGVGPIKFCVVRADKPRYVEFIPREAGGGIKDPNVPANDPRTQFGPNGEMPVATKFYDFVVMLLPSKELIALSFKSTGLKVAKQLNGLIQARGTDIYEGVYQLGTTMTQNAKGRFAIFNVKNAGWFPKTAEGKEMHDYAKDTHHALIGKNIIIDLDTDPNADPDAFDVEHLETSGGDVSKM